MHLNYWVSIKIKKKYAQPIRKQHVVTLKKKVSIVETLQHVLMPPRLTQFINILIAKISTVETDF